MNGAIDGPHGRGEETRESGAELSRGEVRAVQLRVLDAFCRLCDEHRIRYYAYYGTLLGALRHKGFIPWDDDIDLAVPRKDFDRLASIDWTKHDLVLHSADVRRDYPYVVGKIADRATVWMEKADHVFDDLGINIDVFPIDDVPQSAVRSFLEQGSLRVLSALRDLKVTQVSAERAPGKNLALTLAKVLLAPVSSGLLSRGINAVAASRRVPAQYAGSRVGPYGRREIHRRELFDDIVEVEFEGRQLHAPAGYHEILTRIYGDYMTPPPPKMRITHHAFRAYWR